MIIENALAVYRNKPAIVKEKNQDKIVILAHNGEQIKVREKDIEIIHPGPAKDFTGIEAGGNAGEAARETWELLLAEGNPVSLKELAELAFGEYRPAAAWSAYCLLSDGLYFSGTVASVSPRPREQVEAEENKRKEKQRASDEREEFLQRLRGRKLGDGDQRFIQDIEALAYGTSAKSKTMKDIGMGETPEEAHALLLECGFWTAEVNPHPVRFGVSLQPARQIPEPAPEEDRSEDRPENSSVFRIDLTRLAAFAIDNSWSNDPDDAVSFEIENDREILYVHVADPSSAIGIDSPPEREARGRGATLYIPEGNVLMLAEETLPAFALGLTEISPALTFKMTLNADGEIENTEIFPSTVKVKRLTYREADELTGGAAEAALLGNLRLIAERNLKRREEAGAVNIDLPETRISLNRGQVTIEPVIRYRSSDMVRECMLLAGEGVGIWAMQRNIPIPYIEQDMIETPNAILPGLAGSYQLRRCMKPRILSVKPGLHCGLGLDIYTQVTSPLRRYTDLLSHIQIRSFLRNDTVLPADEVAARMFAGEAAALAVTQAERASRSHWTMAYLAGKKDSVWEAVALEKKGARWALVIPAIGLETQAAIRNDIAPNDKLNLILKSVNIPALEAVFIAEE